MTADRDPIQQYLDQLRRSLRIPEAGRIVVEAEDHLRAAAAAGMAAGLTERQAQQAAITGFGPVFYLLAAFFWGVDGLLRPGPVCPARAGSCKLPTLVPETSALAALMSWAVTGIAGLALLAAYFAVRRVQRRRGRVWSVPLGGYFPLVAVAASATVAAGLLLFVTGAQVEPGPWPAIIIYAAVGLVVTYGWRMWRMLRNQARRGGELA